MTQEEIEKKQQECVTLALEIVRMQKIIAIKQSKYNKLDTELYNYFKSQQHETSESDETTTSTCD